MPVHKDLNHDFFRQWSPKMAYVLGFFAADGSMVTSKRGGHFIEFTITDRVVLERIRHATNSGHKITGRDRGANRKRVYRLQIGSKAWFADLTKLGFTKRKSNTLRFPQLSKEYAGDFIRGYFDGDGCVYLQELKFADRRYKRWVLLILFTSGSRPFLESLREAVRPYGVRGGSICKKKRGFDLKFSHQDSVALHQLMYHTVETSDLFLPRKRLKLERAIRVLKLMRS